MQRIPPIGCLILGRQKGRDSSWREWLDKTRLWHTPMCQYEFEFMRKFPERLTNREPRRVARTNRLNLRPMRYDRLQEPFGTLTIYIREAFEAPAIQEPTIAGLG